MDKRMDYVAGQREGKWSDANINCAPDCSKCIIVLIRKQNICSSVILQISMTMHLARIHEWLPHSNIHVAPHQPLVSFLNFDIPNNDKHVVVWLCYYPGPIEMNKWANCAPMSNSNDYAVFKLCCCNAQISYRILVVLFVIQYTHENIECTDSNIPDSRDHGAKLGPTWVMSAPDGPHVRPMNLATKVYDLLLSESGRMINLYFHCRLYRPYTRCNITHRYTMYPIRYWHDPILLLWLVTCFWSLDLCANENIQDLLTKLQISFWFPEKVVCHYLLPLTNPVQ